MYTYNRNKNKDLHSSKSSDNPVHYSNIVVIVVEMVTIAAIVLIVIVTLVMDSSISNSGITSSDNSTIEPETSQKLPSPLMLTAGLGLGFTCNPNYLQF